MVGLTDDQWNAITGSAFLVASIPLYVARIPREEEIMLDQFGDERRWYCGEDGAGGAAVAGIAPKARSTEIY